MQKLVSASEFSIQWTSFLLTNDKQIKTGYVDQRQTN